MQFQATCSKGNKKLTLTLTAGDVEAARAILHSQGYSIIDIHEISETSKQGNFFYFDAKINGILQSGKIQSVDIFKSYKKLVEDLKYDVIYIYTNEGMPEEQKKIITAKVKDGYTMYKESLGEEVDTDASKTQDEIDMADISPQVLREIDVYVKTIDSTIESIQNLILKYHDTITPKDKESLEAVELQLSQTKGTRNLGKIKSITESCLKTVGEIQLTLVKNGMIDEKKKFLEETNALLKQVGSKDRIKSEEEKKEDIGYKLSNMFSRINAPKNTEKPDEKKVDTNSFIYFKNKRELDIYKKSLSNNDVELIKALFTLKIGNVKKLFLKRKLLSQNIQIIENRINNRSVSYTRIIHGFWYYVDVIFLASESLGSIFAYTLFLYSIIFITMTSLDAAGVLQGQFLEKRVFYISIFSIITFLLLYLRKTRTFRGLIFEGIFVLGTVFFLSFLFVNF